MFNKNISLGLSMTLTVDEYKYIFEKYGKNIKELYFSTSLPNPLIHTRRILIEEAKVPENTTKMIKILKMAKSYNINLELAINSRFDLKEKHIKEMYDWCETYGIKIDKVVTLKNLVDTCYKYFGDIKYCYSYNNNIINHDFLDNINPLFSEIVIGNRSIRDVKLMKKIKEKGLKVKLLVDNGCQHNCKWCTNMMASICGEIMEENLKHYSLEFLTAIQTVFPFEIERYYSKLNLIDSYKLSTRTTDYFYFINTLEYFLKLKPINSLEEIPFTAKLQHLINKISENGVNLYKVHKIKEKIWEDILNEQSSVCFYKE